MEGEDDNKKSTDRETFAQCLKRKKRDYIMHGALNRTEQLDKKLIVDSLAKKTEDGEKLKTYHAGDLSPRLLHWLDEDGLCYTKKGYGYNIWVDEDDAKDYGIKKIIPSRKRRKLGKPSEPIATQECVVCKDGEANTTVVPCCHTVACKACSDRLKTSINAKTCILCRQTITHILEPKTIRKIS